MYLYPFVVHAAAPAKRRKSRMPPLVVRAPFGRPCPLWSSLFVAGDGDSDHLNAKAIAQSGMINATLFTTEDLVSRPS